LWWLFDDPKLATNCRELIRNQNKNNRIIVSSASAWEIATKYRIGKLPEAEQQVGGIFPDITSSKVYRTCDR
jgi:PIN domain nuclease of toxin-antitoxin system